MKIEGPAKLIEVYIGESDQWHGRPLYMAITERLKAAGIAGVTVLRGVMGYGAHIRIHLFHVSLARVSILGRVNRQVTDANE